jgi:hypothetical protein
MQHDQDEKQSPQDRAHSDAQESASCWDQAITVSLKPDADPTCDIGTLYNSGTAVLVFYLRKFGCADISSDCGGRCHSVSLRSWYETIVLSSIVTI